MGGLQCKNNENKVMINCTGKPKIAFVCVHNSCRSQIAEALAKSWRLRYLKAIRGGTELKDRINQDAVRLMKSIHGIDMEKDQYSKLIFDIPRP
jgi:Protein-tyrosine-phosphatase